MNSQKKSLPKLYPTDKDTRKTWYVEYTGIDGRRKKIYGRLNHLSTVKDRLKEAQALIKKINDEFTGLPPAVKGRNQLITDLNEVFELRMPGLKSGTIATYKTHFYAFVKWYRLNGCPPMNALQAMKFLNTIQEGKSPTTRNTYRCNLKSLWSDLIRYYKPRYTDNPFAETRKVKESRKTRDWFKPVQVDQLKQVISSLDPQLWLSVKILFHCFIRPNELRQLRVGDINFQTGKIKVIADVAKTDKVRFAPIPSELLPDLDYLKHYPEHYYIFTSTGIPGVKCVARDTLSKRHEAILKSLQYPKGYSYYSWKNTGAVKMLMMDRKPMRYISKCMGHHSLDMTDKYFESLGVDEMGEAILFPLLSSKAVPV